ncbi:MAG TPA: hypothetical protein VGK25_02905 [Ignavibacteria bacterium]
MLNISKHFRRRLGKLNMVITEASFIRKGGLVKQDKTGRKFGYAGIPELINFFKKFTNKIVLTHFGTWFMKDLRAAERKIKALETDSLRIEIAADGKQYKV